MVSTTLQISDAKPKLKYPRAVGFIISNEFCERFNYYGMRTILVLYLTNKLRYDDNTATILFHIFTSLVYLFPLIGAILADSWLGRFKTILYLSIVYSVGGIVIALGAIPSLNLPVNEATVIGLVLIAIGTGGIKPCVSAFGGDQFKLPEQIKQLATFFSLFYFAINAGSLISTSITPILREDVHCFGQNDCFSLAFGVPAVLMVVSVLIFVCGKPLYTMKPPSGNMLLGVGKVIIEAIRNRSKAISSTKSHWLDYAEEKCGVKMVADTKALLKVLVLYLPLPLFWALFDQQGSRWTFQATRMVGDIGGFTIKPDQMQVINPLLILAFIPLFNYALYPLLEFVGIKRPLQKLTLGGLLAATAFLISGFVEMKLEDSYPVLPKLNESQLRIYNVMPCDYNFVSDLPSYENFTVKSMEKIEYKHIENQDFKTYMLEAQSSNPTLCPSFQSMIKLPPGEATSYYMKMANGRAHLAEYVENPDKPKGGVPKVRLLPNVPEDSGELTLKSKDKIYRMNTNETEVISVEPGKYTLKFGTNELGTVNVMLGGVYIVSVYGSQDSGYIPSEHILTEPNNVHMLWQLPQYIVITAGEVMFSVTGLEFSFTQAPSSMKSVLQACWLLSVAIGNMLVVVIAELKLFESQVSISETFRFSLNNFFSIHSRLSFVCSLFLWLLIWLFSCYCVQATPM
ncbi:SLC15A1.2 family protein [Megaselia abdita]